MKCWRLVQPNQMRTDIFATDHKEGTETELRQGVKSATSEAGHSSNRFSKKSSHLKLSQVNHRRHILSKDIAKHTKPNPSNLFQTTAASNGVASTAHVQQCLHTQQSTFQAKKKSSDSKSISKFYLHTRSLP